MSYEIEITGIITGIIIGIISSLIANWLYERRLSRLLKILKDSYKNMNEKIDKNHNEKLQNALKMVNLLVCQMISM